MTDGEGQRDDLQPNDDDDEASLVAPDGPPPEVEPADWADQQAEVPLDDERREATDLGPEP